jgi:glycosyltransferase involved in cell wall biosynthesis
LRAPAGALPPAPDHWACGTPHPARATRYGFRALGLGARPLPAVSLIHAHFATDALDMLPLARRLGVPLLVTLHGYDVGVARRPPWRGDGLHWRWKRHRLMREAHLFLPVSQWLSTAAEAVGFPSDKLRLHYLGTALPMQHERHRDGVVFVGRLVESKGVSDLIEALALLARRGTAVPLTVVGDGPERAAAEAQAVALGVPVHFCGTLSPEATRRLMANAKALVLPSRQDAFGLVLIEAQATGTPVIAYDGTGAREAVGPGGRLVLPGDLAALAEVIGQFITDEAGWRAASSTARTHVSAHFDLAERTALLEALYDGVLGR